MDGGWQTIVDRLRRTTVASGVRIMEASHASRWSDRPSACSTRLADGAAIRASAVVLGGGPVDVDALAGTRFGAALPPSIRLRRSTFAGRCVVSATSTLAAIR